MWLYIITAIASLLALFYYYMTKDFGKYAAQGITEDKGEFPFGSRTTRRMILQKTSFVTFLDELYAKYKKDKFVVYHTTGKPAVMIADIDLAKQVLIKDFDYFMDRRSFDVHDGTKANKVFNRMLTVIKGEKWKAMRASLSPVFTSGKLKSMALIINKCGSEMSTYMEKLAATKEPFEAKNLLMNYTTDVICSAGLGVETDCVRNPENHFRKMIAILTGAEANKWKQGLTLATVLFLPKLAKLLRLNFIDEKATNFFLDVIEKTIEQRKGNKGPKRNDFIDLLLQAINDQDESLENLKEDDQFEKDAEVKVGKNKLADIPKDERHIYLLSQVFIMFFAGFDTSSTMMASSMMFLARNPEIQEKLREEISAKIESSESQSANLTYNEVVEMEYLDMFVSETLRLYPLTSLERQCTKPYTLPGTNLKIEPGMLVQIPACIMTDPDYFEDPETFDPELHFSAEAKAKRSPYTYLAFGQGPRNCIGMRFALLVVKMSLIHILAKYRVIKNEKTGTGRLVPDPTSISSLPIGGTWVSVERL